MVLIEIRGNRREINNLKVLVRGRGMGKDSVAKAAHPGLARGEKTEL